MVGTKQMVTSTASIHEYKGFQNLFFYAMTIKLNGTNYEILVLIVSHVCYRSRENVYLRMMRRLTEQRTQPGRNITARS